MAPNEHLRRLLIIAYYFPPMGLSGVQRTAKFAKYLSRYGWHATVLTVEPGGYYAFDPTLLQEVEEAGVTVVRTPPADAGRLFRRKGVVKFPGEFARQFFGFWGDLLFIPDTKVGWKKKALAAARTIARERPFDAIMATAPPQTDFLIGVELAAELRLPLLLDYRDAWINYPFKHFPTPLHTWLHKRLERRVIQKADKVVVTHRRMKEQLIQRHGRLQYNDVSILSQGYDEEDLQGVTGRPPADVLTITHTGTFYGRRAPEPLLKALHLLYETKPEYRGRIRIRFVGATRASDERAAKRWRVTDSVTFDGYLEHRESVRALLASDVLWYVNDNDLSSPGKLYEYFAAGRTILATVVDGYTRQLIEESKGAVVVRLGDVGALVRTLEELVRMKETKSLPRVPKEFAEKFERTRLTGELARHLEGLLEYDKGEVVRVGGTPA